MPVRSIPDGWLPHDVYKRLIALLPDASIVGIDDMLEKIRAIKSEEELGVLRKAAALGRSHAGHMPRHRPARHEGMRSLWRHDARP